MSKHGNDSNDKEAAHYVVTAHPPGAVLLTAKCNFCSPTSMDVIVAKSRRLEIRQVQTTNPETTATNHGTTTSSPFPLVCTIPIHGRITAMVPFQLPLVPTSLVFLMTERQQYAVVSYNENSFYKCTTHASGSFQGDDSYVLGRQAECGPLVSIDYHKRCIAIHLLDGLLSIIPINNSYDGTSVADKHKKRRFSSKTTNSLLGEPYHAPMEERTVLDLVFLQTNPQAWPQISLLHQDSRCQQHVTTHVVDLKKKRVQLFGTMTPAQTDRVHLLKKSRVDGGSAKLIAMPWKRTQATGKPKSTGEEQDTQQQDDSANSNGGLLVLGQLQITFLSVGVQKCLPMSQALLLQYETLSMEDGNARFLLGDEFGNLLLLVVYYSTTGLVTGMGLDVLGTTHICSSLNYLQDGLLFVGSQFGDSQLFQIIKEALPEAHSLEPSTSCLELLEEYTHLGPIVDFDLVPTSNHHDTLTQVQQQSQVVTASGTSFSGTLRLIRNGIGMNEYASVEIPGILSMFNIKASFFQEQDAYLIQSFVGETRVLGVKNNIVDENAMEEEDDNGGTLEEVFLPGLDSESSSLFVANVQVGDSIVQVTETEIRLLNAQSLQCIDSWSPTSDLRQKKITVAAGNGAGQVVVALEGSVLLYFCIQQDQNACKIVLIQSKEMEREVSCINLNPFVSIQQDEEHAMQVDTAVEHAIASRLVAVGLWDDFTVRLLSLEDTLEQLLEINLSNEQDPQDEEEMEETPSQPLDAKNPPSRNNRNNMMARSLCLVTLDSSSPSTSSSGSGGVNMLFVGLGDGTLVSFAVIMDSDKFTVTVRSKKQVSLGTQRINLVPLYTEGGGTCVLATGDRPTVIYLAGGGGSSGSFSSANFSNPKLCYSNVNLSSTPSDSDDSEDIISRPPAQQSIAINVATPLTSSVLFDTSLASGGSSQHYSLCVADHVDLRLGVIDDIQKLHVTTCRLGMAPRRIVHCPQGRLFAVGCIESGVREGGALDTNATLGNCIRFLDDTNFDDVHRIDLEPHELILSMDKINMCTTESSIAGTTGSANLSSGGVNDSRRPTSTKPYLLVGTAYAFPDEDEPTRGRILVYACSSDDGVDGGKGAVRQVTELLVHGGVYSMCQFFQGKALVTVNSKTQVCHLVDDGTGIPKLTIVGIGHHGHILSLFVKSRAQLASNSTGPTTTSGTNVAAAATATASATIPVLQDTPTKTNEQSGDKGEQQEEQLAIVGDLMRSVSLVQYYSKHESLEEIARDFNANWTTAVEMLTDDVYLGAENWNNLFVLRRNAKAQSEEVRCRLDTIGEFHLGEMVNKFMSGSLIMPQSHTSSSSSSSDASIRGMNLRPTPKSPVKSGDGNKRPAASTRTTRRPTVTIGSQTLFGTVDGSLGSIIGLDLKTAVFFGALQRAMERTISPVGDFSHYDFRTFQAEQRVRPSHGFVDGDLVESFLDLDRETMDAVVREMNDEDGWEVEEHIGAASGDNQGGGSGSGGSRRRSLSDDDDDEHMSNNGGSVLTVEDVLAMVEEMTMLH